MAKCFPFSLSYLEVDAPTWCLRCQPSVKTLAGMLSAAYILFKVLSVYWVLACSVPDL